MSQHSDSAFADTASPVQPDTLHRAAAHGGEVNLDMILDVPVTLAMELGRNRINIRNLLHLNQGSEEHPHRAPGDPLDVFVNWHPDPA